MKTLKIYILSGFVLFAIVAKAQQIPQFTQHIVRPSLYNPAFTGMDDALCFYAAGRSQWIGFKDENNKSINPVNLLFGISKPFYSIHSGIGLSFGKYDFAYQSEINVTLDYAYKKEISDDQFLSVGVTLKLNQITLDVDKLAPVNPGDPLLMEAGKQKDFVPEAGIGFLYTVKNKWWAGVSILNLLGSTATLGNIELNDKTTLVAQGLYKIRLVDERRRKIDLAPAFIVKTYFKGTQVDLNVVGYFNDRFWLGTGYRLDDGALFLGGIQTDNWKLGLSYDFTTNRLRKATSAGSAEVHLSYCIPLTKEVDSRIKSSGRSYNPKLKMKSKFNTRHL